jgi:RNA polymerase sigma-70 factor (ECF subfamily)
MNDNPGLEDDIRSASRQAFVRFLDAIAPFRPELHRLCRRLTGDIWDAEDLVQDTVLKAFGALGRVRDNIDNPRGYLVRIATNLWIDKLRHRVVEMEALSTTAVTGMAAAPPPGDPMGARNAAAIVLGQLSPQEGTALVLKEVFDMSLREIAENLATTENAVKAALHRGRTKLQDDVPLRPRPASRALIERFVKCVDTLDLEGLLALMADTATIELPPMLSEVGRKQFEKPGSWLWQSVHVHPELPADLRPPKWINRVVEFRGEWVALGLLPSASGGTLQGVNRFEEAEGKVSRIRSYCFAPETIAEVAANLGLQAGNVPYRFPGAG